MTNKVAPPKFSLLFLALFLAIGIQENSSAAPISFDSSQWSFVGEAAMQSDGSVLLTSLNIARYGRITYTPGICAKEFKISYEMNLGTNIGSTGGSGLSFLMQNSAGITEYRAHADTFLNSTEDSRFELNDNHVSIDSLGAYTDLYGNPPTVGTTTFGPFAAAFVPFRLEGTGWIRTTFYKKANAVDVTVTDGTHGLELTSNIYYEPGTTIYPVFEAATGTAKNEQRVRNIQIEVLDRSDCPDYVPPMTHAEALAVIASVCGDNADCPPRADYLPCVEEQIAALVEEERLAAEMSDLISLEAQFSMSYCDGLNQCMANIDLDAVRQAAFDNGFQAGVASVDQDALRAEGYNNGFQAGAASIDQAAIHQTGYNEGFTAGAASVDQNAIRQAGYNDGFAAGAGSVDQNAIRQAGYDDGFSAGAASIDQNALKQEGYTLGYQDGAASIDIAAIRAEALAIGRQEGYSLGYEAGLSEGSASGRSEGYAEGFLAGSTEGYTKGLVEGKLLGYDEGKAAGEAAGYEEGYNAGLSASYDAGYSDGFEYASAACEMSKKFKISLTPICSAHSDKVKRWQVKNSLPIPVVLSWELFKSGQKGVVVVRAKSDAIIETQAVQSGPNVLRLFFLGDVVSVKAANHANCSNWGGHRSNK